MQAALAHVDLTVLGRGGFVFLAVFLVEHGEEHLDHLAGFEGLAGAFRGADAQVGHLAGRMALSAGLSRKISSTTLTSAMASHSLIWQPLVTRFLSWVVASLIDRGAALAVFGFVGNLDGHRRLSLLSEVLLVAQKPNAGLTPILCPANGC